MRPDESRLEAAALPGCLLIMSVPRRRSGGGGGFTCKLHVAAHAARQASQSDTSPTTAPPAPLGTLQSLQLHDHSATLVRSARVI
jgi:hypothetical protein